MSSAFTLRWIVIGAVIVLIAPILSSCEHRRLNKVCIDNVCLYAEIADTPQQLERGLMFRKNMPLSRGMLFVFPKQGVYPFWMKNTYFPLDMIWIDAQKRIVFIYENALPCKDICKTIIPPFLAKYTLEVNAGVVQRYHLRVGDKVKF